MAKGTAKTPFFAWIVIAVLVLILLQRLAKSATTADGGPSNFSQDAPWAPGASASTPYAPGSNLPGPYSPDLGPVYGPPRDSTFQSDSVNYVELPNAQNTPPVNPLNPYAAT